MGYNRTAYPQPRRPAINQHDPVRSHLIRLKSKRFWTPPVLIGLTSAYQFFNEPLAELIAAWLPPALSPIATFISESVDAVNPAYVTLAVGFTIYWLAGEPWIGIGRELFTMGLKNFSQTAKQDAINQIVDDSVAKARTETRNELLQELRKMTPDEIAAMLEREMPASNGNGATPN